MLKEVGSLSQKQKVAPQGRGRTNSRLRGVSPLEEMLMDHQAKQVLTEGSNEEAVEMVGLDDALMQLQIEGERQFSEQQKGTNR